MKKLTLDKTKFSKEKKEQEEWVNKEIP